MLKKDKPVLLDPLKCGECGNDTFRLKYEQSPGTGRFGGGGRHEGSIVVECTKCSSKSCIEPSPAALETNGEGTLCGDDAGNAVPGEDPVTSTAGQK